MKMPAGPGIEPLGLVAEVVFFYLTIEGGEPDVEEAGGFGLIAFCVVEDPLDVEFFYAGEVECGEGAAGSWGGDPQFDGEVVDVELRSVG